MQNFADGEKSFTPKAPRKSKANTEIKTKEATKTSVVVIRGKSQRPKSNPPEVKLAQPVEMPAKRKRNLRIKRRT